MDISKKRCGECGQMVLKFENVKNKFTTPWKDFPVVYLTVDHEMAVCQNCGNKIEADYDQLNDAIKASIVDQTRQFIDIIKNKSDIKLGKLAAMMGITPSYLSSLHAGSKIPSFLLWNTLKIVALNPKDMCSQLDPEFDIIKENLLIRNQKTG